MHDNALSYVFKLTREFLEHKINRRKNTGMAAIKSDLNAIKNLWWIVKIKLYESSKRYNSKADPWEVTKTSNQKKESAEF